MRFLNKTNRCEPFDSFVVTYQGRLRNEWTKFKKVANGQEVKRQLHTHLWLEQKGLCAYCEQEIPKEDNLKSHAEHVRSQRDFKHLTFVFENIILSCEGFNLILEEREAEEKRQFCAHMKDRTFSGIRNYDDALFLNPTEIMDIETYFRYDSEGKIEANPQKTDAEKARADYMIRVLELNHSILIEMRRNQYDIWLEKQMTLTEADLIFELHENQPFLPAFFTMLKEKIL